MDSGQLDYETFLTKMKQIKEIGYVKSHRPGDTGIGKTLEDLLGIAENNIAGPDFATYELKAARRDSVSMLTLFTKAPLPKHANANLLDSFGYTKRRKTGISEHTELSAEGGPSRREKELHVTVDSLRPNSVGLQLQIRGDVIYIGNQKGVKAYYTSDVLRETFERKYHNLVYVLADHEKHHGEEYFWYNETRLLRGFSFEKFSQLIASGELKLDLRLGHYADGRPHDHGTGFRILPKHLPDCFHQIEKIL